MLCTTLNLNIIAFKSLHAYERHNQNLMSSFQLLTATVYRHVLKSCQQQICCFSSLELRALAYVQTQT